jgi:SpoVK/Ycf46/Vps4 family AAA+-type ATPase
MIEKHRPIVVMIEDIDAIVDKKGESAMLALLDGELQIDNVVFVATTNYPERLDKRLVNRPSRFDEIIKIGMPSAAARAQYIINKVPRLAPEGFRNQPGFVERTVNAAKRLLTGEDANVEKYDTNARLITDEEITGELKIWVDGSDNMSIAHIREIIISVECLGNPVEQTIARIRKMNQTKPSSTQESDKTFGFGE